MADTRYGFVDTITKRTLLNRAIAFINNYRDFTEDIFPYIKVPSSKFQWVKFGKEAMEVRNTERALYTDAEELNLTSIFNEGQTQSHSIALPVDIKELDNAYDGYDVYAEKQAVALRIIMNSKMKEISDISMDTVNSYLTGNNINIDGTTRKKWDSDESDPLVDILDLKKVVEDSCGIEPNRLIIGKSYWRVLVKNESIRQMITPISGVGSKLDKNNAANLFEAEKIVIPMSNYWDESQEKFINMFDNMLIWAYVDSDNMTPAWGNTFIKQEPETYQEIKNRYITRVGADVEYSVLIRSTGSAAYINNALS